MPKECVLNLVLFPYGGVEIEYDSTSGFKRQIALSGRVDDPYEGSGPDYSSPLFHGKRVHVTISSPPDAKWLTEFATSQAVSRPCGSVFVRAGVQPEPFEDYLGESSETDPISVSLQVAADAFDVIHRQLGEAYDQQRLVGADLTLVGSSLPDLDEDSYRIWLKDLDVSSEKSYAVGRFEISDSRHAWKRQRVLPVREGFGASISILLTEVRYGISIGYAGMYPLTCEGRVIGSKFGAAKPYDDANATIEFSPFESDQYDELPERALFGEFSYSPKGSGVLSNYLSVELRYAPDDARDCLIPILTQRNDAEIVLIVNTTKEEGEFAVATEEIHGKVLSYGFKVRKQLPPP